MAVQFGYAPGFLWIVSGAVIAGTVHDMVIHFASIRHKGKSLAEIAREEIGPVSKAVATVATFLIIILALVLIVEIIVDAVCSWVKTLNPSGAIYQDPPLPEKLS